VLRGNFEDGDFLDLYAGSGAVGFEALSRGARCAVLVESHPAALRVLEANRKLLVARGAAPDALVCMRRDARAFCATEARAGGARFATVFADPPFDLDFSGLWNAMRPLLAPGGTGIVQFPARTPPDFVPQADRVLEYGESALAVFRDAAC
jgi:16S rRNA (guanine966-N2)-methyltransferase